MLCKVTKEEAIQLNVLADQASNMIGAGVGSALAIVATAGKPACMMTSALVHAAANHLLGLLLSHRQAHGEFKEIHDLKILKRRADALLALAGDLNEIFAGVLRGIDPKNDYMLNLFQTERSNKPEVK